MKYKNIIQIPRGFSFAGGTAEEGYNQVSNPAAIKEMLKRPFKWSESQMVHKKDVGVEELVFQGTSTNSTTGRVALRGINVRGSLMGMGTEVGREVHADIHVINHVERVVNEIDRGGDIESIVAIIGYAGHGKDYQISRLRGKFAVTGDIRFKNELKFVRIVNEFYSDLPKLREELMKLVRGFNYDPDLLDIKLYTHIMGTGTEELQNEIISEIRTRGLNTYEDFLSLYREYEGENKLMPSLQELLRAMALDSDSNVYAVYDAIMDNANRYVQSLVEDEEDEELVKGFDLSNFDQELEYFYYDFGKNGEVRVLTRDVFEKNGEEWSKKEFLDEENQEIIDFIEEKSRVRLPAKTLSDERILAVDEDGSFYFENRGKVFKGFKNGSLVCLGVGEVSKKGEVFIEDEKVKSQLEVSDSGLVEAGDGSVFLSRNGYVFEVNDANEVGETKEGSVSKKGFDATILFYGKKFELNKKEFCILREDYKNNFQRKKELFNTEEELKNLPIVNGPVESTIVMEEDDYKYLIENNIYLIFKHFEVPGEVVKSSKNLAELKDNLVEYHKENVYRPFYDIRSDSGLKEFIDSVISSQSQWPRSEKKVSEITLVMLEDFVKGMKSGEDIWDEYRDEFEECAVYIGGCDPVDLGAISKKLLAVFDRIQDNVFNRPDIYETEMRTAFKNLESVFSDEFAEVGQDGEIEYMVELLKKYGLTRSNVKHESEGLYQILVDKGVKVLVINPFQEFNGIQENIDVNFARVIKNMAENAPEGRRPRD